MGFTDKQIADLSAKLSSDVVKSRKQGGATVSYVEGWHAIAEANRIFGFDRWSRETVYLKEVARYEVPKLDWDEVSKKKVDNGSKQWKVGYEAKVQISVLADGQIVHREGTGYGQGTMGDLYDAMESAGKEAETDAMKRALMTFGNPFGLALYDKERTNVSHEPLIDERVMAAYKIAVEASEDLQMLKDIWAQIQAHGHDMQATRDLVNNRKKELAQ